MTKTRSELLLASKNAITGTILYTFRLTMPRVVLSEINTHCMLAKCTSSSRAIPGKKMRAAVLNDPYIPTSLGKAQKGMQAGAEITGWRRKAILLTLKASRYPSVLTSWLLEALGAAKQVSNRILESHSWTTQILSATDLDNFFLLRNHPDAEPNFGELARQMQEQVEEAVSEFAWMEDHGEYVWKGGDGTGVGRLQILNPGEWHLPFIRHDEQDKHVEVKKKISAARCARTSYTLLDTGKVSDPIDDIRLCNRLFGSNPKHMSPAEHQGQAMADCVYYAKFKGFRQYRKELETA